MAADGKLEYCMDSLIHQTISDYEVIAVDDCSSDDSLLLLQSYRDRYPEKVRVFQTDRNRHQGGAKNLGLQEAEGEWIGFIDSDDWVTEEYYERLLSLAEKTGADMVGCDYGLTAEHSMKPGKRIPNNRLCQTGPLTEEKYRSLLIDHGSLVVKIYRREIIYGCESRFPEDIFYEDNALAGTWMLRAKHFEYIPEPLYYYYQHEASTVHTVTLRRLADRTQAGRIMLREAQKYGYYEKYRNELEFSFTQLFYINTLFSGMRDLKEKGKYAFLSRLAREMEQTFPDFQQNPYYKERTDPEEKKLIALQMRSPLRFYIYYQLLWTYRRLRYGRTG